MKRAHRAPARTGGLSGREPPRFTTDLGRHLPRRRHACSAATARRSACPRVHDPRPGRFGGPAERGPHRAGAGQDRQAVPQEGNLHGHLQPLRQRPPEARRTCSPALSLVPGMGRRAEGLFDAYVDRKEAAACSDYDDLLLYWHALAGRPAGRARWSAGSSIACWSTSTRTPTPCRPRSSIGCRPHGRGLTVVGDDAQSIYSFRAATVRNILDFPKHTPTRRSSPWSRTTAARSRSWSHQPGDRPGAGAVHQEPLVRARAKGERPRLVACEDEDEQTEFVIRQILAHREAGVALRRQAVLFRASHHSMLLEAELTAAEDSLPQIWRAEVRRDGPRQGPAGLPAAGREPARRGGRRAAVAACCRASGRPRPGS